MVAETVTPSLLTLVGQLLDRVARLEAQVREHEEWLCEIAEDLSGDENRDASGIMEVA